ncbi:MAG: HlyC/CorC family transporter [Deltaproteobacteria bacterium]|nr:HlyC/CorC family transporter [Deltaproteobacteria bacterium]
MILVLLLIFVPLLILEGFFSMSETSLVSANRRRLQSRAEEGHRGARLALKLLEKPERLMATCLVGSNLSEISNTVLVTAVLLAWLGPMGELVAVLLLPPLILLLAEITPKSIGRQHSTWLSQRLAPIVWLLSWVLAPLTAIFAGVSRLFLWLTGARQTSSIPFITREDLHLVVKKGGPEMDLETGERRIINRILRFSLRTVGEVMVPLVRVAAISDTSTVAQALAEFHNTPYTRLPVYHRRVDHLIGALHGFDLLGEEPSDRPLKPFIRPVHYVPEIKKIDQLLPEMQRLGIHLAVVVDEFGGAVGIVTMEDLLEEIVGEIDDEFDQKVAPWKKLGEGHYLINGRTEITALNEALHLELPHGDYETLAGLLIALLGDLPRPGEQLRLGNLRFVVRTADPRTVKEVELIVTHPSE